MWDAGPEDYRQAIQEQSPWTFGGGVPQALAPESERPLARAIAAALDAEPHRFQLISGPRRVGKTTVMYQAVRHLLESGHPPRSLWLLRLDHPLLLPSSLGELVRSVLEVARTHPAVLFLDELAYAQRWDLWLKTFYDEHWPVRIVATSSATADLHRRRLETGVGRWEEQHLAPCLLSEYLALRGQPSAFEAEPELWRSMRAAVAGQSVDLAAAARVRRRLMITGGFPELVTTLGEADERTLVFRSQQVLRDDAIERAIYKDIPQTYQVRDPMQLERLLHALAGQLGGILSPSRICSELGALTQPTFDRYLAYLLQTFMVFTLPNYSGRELSVQRRGRKLYFVDGAVRNAALQRGDRFLSAPEEEGLLLENLVVTHFRALAEQTGTRLYYWRDGRDEVDLVYDDPNHPIALEIGRSSAHSRRGLAAFRAVHPHFECWLTAPDAPHLAPTDASDGFGAMPLDLLLIVLGAQTELALMQRFS